MGKSYIKGIIGGLLGGLITTIPWIIAYAYGNMILSLLAIIVAIGVLKGYQLLEGKIDKKLPIIVAILSFVCITLATLVIIPCLLLMKDGVSFTIENIKYLYSNDEFLSAIMRDYAVSILFTFLGISGVIVSIKNQINNSESLENIKFDFNNGNNKNDKEKVREYFVSKNAINEENLLSVTKESGLNLNTVDLLIKQGVVIKKDDKYYYSLDKGKKYNRNSKIITIFVCAMLAISLVFIVIGNTSDDAKNNDEVQFVEKNINVSINDNYREYIDDENEYSWFYMPKKDLSGESGFINVYYFASNITYSEDFTNQVKTNLEGSGGKVLKYEHFKNNHNLDVLRYDYQYENYVDYIYYIIGKGNIGVVEVLDYKNNKTLQKDGLEIVKNYKWL